ncbi:hypothetical protein [uncultured Ilyobacter sp.]|uniref:hypothetical protein n=1 Tax=uncultured Ilyobacter sp. TaxID=544433 RepID=UPI0029BFC72E|nr:hypothetical protein [uncultured Ilyobacter sp.]
MKKKKAYTIIELIMAVGSLLLVLGVFSVVVKTYLEEFSEGTLGERKWADVQTFFTYVSRDLEELSENLGSEETLEINSNGTIEIKSSEGTMTDSVVYSVDSTGNISRDGTVIVKVNKNFGIDGLGLKIYENSLEGNSINSNWEYDELEDDPVRITSEAGSNYYIEPVISLSEGSEITGGYALRFDNVTTTTELTTEWNQTVTEAVLSTITISDTGYVGEIRDITLTAEYTDSGNSNKIASVEYNDDTITTSQTDKKNKNDNPATYEWTSRSIGDTMEFEFNMENGANGSNKYIEITVTLSEP